MTAPTKISMPQPIGVFYDFEGLMVTAWAIAEHTGRTVPVMDVPELMARLIKEQEAKREKAD